MTKADDILKFWFETAGPKRWFSKSDAFDSDVRGRFETVSIDLAAYLTRHKTHPWEADAPGALALIVALDQFPRNMYRGTKAMFAWDGLSLSAAKRAVDTGHDYKTDQSRRAFIYMPYMHSEHAEDQQRCVDLCDARLTDESTLRHAKAHYTVIERFGRFPHRNPVLGRESTAEETQFLESGGYAP